MCGGAPEPFDAVQVRAHGSPIAARLEGSGDDALTAVALMKDHGLDLADLSIGFNTDEMNPMPFGNMAFMVDRAARVRRAPGRRRPRCARRAARPWPPSRGASRDRA